MGKMLSVRANEEGTIVITAAVTDAAGAAVAPTTMLYTLTDLDGTVINSVEDENIGTPEASEDIVLSGDDLPTDGSDRELLLLVYGTYTSTEGAGLPFNEQVRFWVNDLKAVS